VAFRSPKIWGTHFGDLADSTSNCSWILMGQQNEITFGFQYGLWNPTK
jgi:hypothetical protein